MMKTLFAAVPWVLFLGPLSWIACLSSGEGISLQENPVPGTLVLAEGSKTDAVVMVAQEATEPEVHAAQELTHFLTQVTGAAFEVVRKPPKGKKRLLVGPDAARLADARFSVEGLGEEGLVIKSMGNDLILAGGRPRGTLYAVYTFLEDHVGCRWWSSKASTLPKRATLSIEPLDVRYLPPLEYREPFWYNAFDGDWAVRNRCNGHAHRLDAPRGERHIYEGFVHTFYSLIPPAEYFESHPEWFSEIDGKRKHEGSQLCLTNEEMRKELVKNLKIRLRNNPAATIASVSQNDWYGNCRCARCAAVDESEASPAGSLLHFINAVAAEIEEEFPRVAISTLAYQYTRKPPKQVRPRSNVIVRLCSIECSFSKPLSNERNQEFRDDILGWSKICNRLYIWDYTTNFRHHILPHPNLRVLGPNVQFFCSQGVKGIFEQGAYATPGAEMAELRAWVLAKLLWNPSLQGEKLIDEFIEGYYGPAGVHIRAYLKVIHDAVERSGDWLGCFSGNDAKFLSFPVLSEGRSCLKAAEEAVKDLPDLLQRVQVAQLPVIYAIMMRWEEMQKQAEAAGTPWPLDPSIDTLFDDFMKIARAEGINRLSEWTAGFGELEDAVKRVKQR